MGIWAGYEAGSVVDHNTIDDLPYSGISVGWGWNQPEAQKSVLRDNRITNNRITNVMRVEHAQHDGGAIYTQGAQPWRPARARTGRRPNSSAPTSHVKAPPPSPPRTAPPMRRTRPTGTPPPTPARSPNRAPGGRSTSARRGGSTLLDTDAEARYIRIKLTGTGRVALAHVLVHPART
ncbi:hypothetical protein AB0H77_04075 [Streptomyces sp. NPDC050844]|uniref:hypothetical protein n=1 Tax=Streptomyces sp. NPDC050844 TaxID=3155790 RepID=UPI0034095B2A